MASSSIVIKGCRKLISGDPMIWRRLRQECARIAAKLFGDFPLSEDYKLWRQDKDFLADYKKLSPWNPYSQDRKYTLREFVKFVDKVPGEMAECGCFQGASAYFIAKQAPNVPLHIFDSFEGLSEVTPEDVMTGRNHAAWRPGDFKASEEELQKTLSSFQNIHIHKGWIPKRFPDVSKTQFRLIHIDLDLYQPILDSLEFFYPRMSEGGVIVFDDYGFTTCPGAHKAVTTFMSGKPEYVIHLPTGQGIIIVSKGRH